MRLLRHLPWRVGLLYRFQSLVRLCLVRLATGNEKRQRIKAVRSVLIAPWLHCRTGLRWLWLWLWLVDLWGGHAWLRGQLLRMVAENWLHSSTSKQTNEQINKQTNRLIQPTALPKCPRQARPGKRESKQSEWLKRRHSISPSAARADWEVRTKFSTPTPTDYPQPISGRRKDKKKVEGA